MSACRATYGAARARALAKSIQPFALAVSLGEVESLVCRPASMTHTSLTSNQRAELGITDDLLRLSVGIEELDDLIAGIGRALDATRAELVPAAALSRR